MNPLVRLRLAKDFTQKDLAERLGINAGRLCQWETGRRRPEAGMYGKLARELGVSTQEIVEAVASTVWTEKETSSSAN